MEPWEDDRPFAVRVVERTIEQLEEEGVLEDVPEDFEVEMPSYHVDIDPDAEVDAEKLKRAFQKRPLPFARRPGRGGEGDDEVLGTPRLQPVYNVLQDLRKRSPR